MLTTATLVSEVRDVVLLEDYQPSKLHNRTNEIHTRAVPNPIPTGCLAGGVKYSPAPSGRPRVPPPVWGEGSRGWKRGEEINGDVLSPKGLTDKLLICCNCFARDWSFSSRRAEVKMTS